MHFENWDALTIIEYMVMLSKFEEMICILITSLRPGNEIKNSFNYLRLFICDYAHQECCNSTVLPSYLFIYLFIIIFMKRQTMNEQSEKSRKQFTYESTIKEFYYDRSVVPIEKPLEKMDWKLRQ